MLRLRPQKLLPAAVTVLVPHVQLYEGKNIRPTFSGFPALVPFSFFSACFTAGSKSWSQKNQRGEDKEMNRNNYDG